MLPVSQSAPLEGKSPHHRRLWAARVGLIIVGSVVLLLAVTTIYQARAEEADLRAMPAPGLLQVDRHAMHLWCTGSGAPTVLLVSGNVSYSLDWTLVQPTLSNTTRVCSYDRAGLGWSEPNPAPRTASRIAGELGALIAASGEQSPFVVVGHSYGGIISRLFVARHRGDVAGLVLVDAVDDRWLEQLQPGNAGFDSMLMISDGLATANRLGLLRLIGNQRGAALFPDSMPFHRLPPEAREPYLTIAKQTSFWIEAGREERAIHDSVVAVSAELGPLGDLPLVVLSADDPTAPQHIQDQESLLGLSTHGRNVVAHDSGHFIQVDRPDVVIDAVEDLVAGGSRVTSTPSQELADAPAATTALDLNALDAYVESQMQTARIPGLAVGVIKNGEVIAMRGYGQADPSGRPVTPQTPFNIGSNTKSFTALAIMQLVDAGKLELDAPVQRYIPWFRMADAEAAARITVRHLLNQTSGISNADGLLGMTWTGTESGSLERYVRVLADRPLNRPVGQSYEYSNANYVVLGLIVEAVSGQTYEDYVQQHIFTPLEMRDSYTAQEAAMRNGMAVGYRWWFGIPVPAYLPDDRAVVSAGMLIASVEDMTHYLLAQINEGRYGAVSVISPSGMAELHRPAIPMRGTTPGMPSLSYAMGWAVEQQEGTTILQHDGAWLNSFQSMKVVPEERTAVVVNSDIVSLLDTFTGAPAADHIATGVLAIARQQPPPDSGPRIAQLTLFENATVVLATGLFLAWLACMPRWYQRVARRGIFNRGELLRRSTLTLGLHGVVPAILAYLFATMPGLRVSALMQPDLAAWLAGLAAATVLKGTAELVLLWRVFRRSGVRAVTQLGRGIGQKVEVAS